MAHSGKTITFATDLLPNEDNIYNLGTAGLRWKIHGNILPIATKSYTLSTANNNANNIYGTANTQAACSFYFMSVRPTTWNIPWQIRFRVRTYCPGYLSTDSYTWCTLNGSQDHMVYHNWNERTNDVGHYYIAVRILKSAGYSNSLGHAVGIDIRDGKERTNSNYYRYIEVELYDTVNCSVTFLDKPVLWAGWANGTDTNYNGYSDYDAVNRGLRESGDDNTTSISHLYEQYGGWVAANLLCRYQLVFENIDHKFVSIFGTDNAYNTTNKTLLTVDFDPNGRIFYHNTTGTTAANANIDPGRLYYAVLADLRYTFNVTDTTSSSTFTGVRYNSLYLKTQMTASTGMVHVASNLPLVTTLPTSNDGYYYIYLGLVHDWYRVMMTGEHPVYYHDGNKIVLYIGNNIGVKKHIIDEKVTMQWNSTDSALEFVFT